jgi:hypothetical protein
MKQVLFILLVFISFQGFSQTQTVKLYQIRLEVMNYDLGEWDDFLKGRMKWQQAKTACENLGGGWRLPTIQELQGIYQFRYKLDDYQEGIYWSSTESDSDFYPGWNQALDFEDGSKENEPKQSFAYVRAVRTLK